MKNSVRRSLSLPVTFLLLAAILLPCAAQKKKTEKSSDRIKLVYNYPADNPVRYVSSSKIVQNMDINGQTMQSNINSIFGCSVKSLGLQDENLKIEITIDTLGQTLESPMGSTGGGISSVEGKVFAMLLSRKGKEVDVSEAGNVTYDNQGVTANLTHIFMDFFPDLPDQDVTAGFTWVTSDSTTNTSATTETTTRVKAENKFEGFENIDGKEYAKITSALSGTQEIKTQSQGMDIFVSGPFKGTMTILFDQSKGYFVKQINTSSLVGTIEITGPESMSFPMLMEVNQTVEVVK